MNTQGKVIVLEGVDGAGKTTQLEYLRSYLSLPEQCERFGKTVFVHEPGGNELGEKLRELILAHTMDAKTEILLFFASRNELLQKTVFPLLNEGKNIIYDRFELSTFAYQVYGRQREDLRDFVLSLSREIVPEHFVDHLFFLDLDVEIAKERDQLRDAESTRFDLEGIEFFNRVREGYKRELPRYPHTVIDASCTREEIREELIRGVEKVLKS